jgi:hypothetical protein
MGPASPRSTEDATLPYYRIGRPASPGLQAAVGPAGVDGGAVDVVVAGGGDEDVDPVPRSEPDGGVGLDELTVAEDRHREVTGWPVEFTEGVADGRRGRVRVCVR